MVAGLALLLCLAVLTLVAIWTYPARKPPGVTPENFRRLHQGMTEKQVEAILGSPGMGWVFNLSYGREYAGDGCDVRIEFGAMNDNDEKVTAQQGWMTTTDGSVLELAEKPISLFDRLRLWLGLLASLRPHVGGRLAYVLQSPATAPTGLAGGPGLSASA
jgi:hypothetical protein